jgi:hypothetical protein
MVYREVFRLMRVDLETGPFNHCKLIAETQMGLPATIFLLLSILRRWTPLASLVDVPRTRDPAPGSNQNRVKPRAN